MQEHFGSACPCACADRDRGIHAKTDASRGFDHAAFVPLLGLMPEADIPVVAMSVISSMDPKASSLGDPQDC